MNAEKITIDSHKFTFDSHCTKREREKYFQHLFSFFVNFCVRHNFKNY